MNKIRFDFLDGIRGLAALWVVLYHSMLFNGYVTESIKWSDNILLNILQKPLSIGSLAVAVFIVLSGFCLAIPVVNNNLELKGGFRRYIFRRAKRLIPPYFIALALSLAIIFIFPLLREFGNTAWDSKIPVTKGAIISHLGLFHNLRSDWIFKINGAHWSVATEWQIYWFFPLMLLLWRKFNAYVSFILIFIIAVGFRKFIPFAVPEFLILFFMGVICCYLSFNAKFFNRINIPLSIISLLAVLTVFIFKKVSPLKMNLIVGVFFSYFLYASIVYKRLRNRKIFLLESNPVEFLGKISYSLYLVHGPFLALANLYLLKNFTFGDDIRQLLLFGFVIVFVLPFSAVFYHLVEKRFLNK